MFDYNFVYENGVVYKEVKIDKDVYKREPVMDKKIFRQMFDEYVKELYNEEQRRLFD